MPSFLPCLSYLLRFAAADIEVAARRSIVFVCAKGRHRSPAVCAMYLLRARFVSSPEDAMQLILDAARAVRPESALPQFKDEGPQWAPGLRPIVQEYAALAMPIVALPGEEEDEEEEEE